MWEAGEFSDEWLGNNAWVQPFLEVTRTLRLGFALSKSGTRSHIVNVLLDGARNMILFSRDIFCARDVLPDEELSNE